MYHLMRVDARETLQPGSSDPKESRVHWLLLQEPRLDHEAGRGVEAVISFWE